MFPTLLETRYFILHTMWVFFAIAMIVATFGIIRLALRHHLKIQFLSEHSLKLILGAILGGRLVYVLLHLPQFFSEIDSTLPIRLIAVWDTGVAGWGAIAGLIGTLYYLCKKYEQNFWKWMDIFVPALLFALSILHIGTFLDGRNYGHETNLPWGVNFENMSVKYAVPIHPTQIYAALYSVALGAGMIILSHMEWFKKHHKDGTLALIGITAYGLLRFAEEFLRGDDTWLIFGIRLPFILSLIITITAGVFLYLRYNTIKFKS